MGSYKQPCIHCGTLTDRGAPLCAGCGSRSPFGYRCPSCLAAVERTQRLCASCGHSLRVICPHCGGETFADERCERCGASLMKRCPNRRCGEPQFFENDKCTACGKRI